MIQFVRSRRRHKPGDKVEYQPGVEDILVRRGFAIYVPMAAECAMMAPPETASLPRPKARRGRKKPEA